MKRPWHLPSPRVTRHEGALAAAKPILEIVVVALFVIAFIAQPVRIPSASMQPTLRVGDFLLVDKQTFAPTGPLDALLVPIPAPHRGDVIVFHYPVDPNTLLVKRIIGLPGDHLRLRHGRVYRNGELLTEPYAFYSPARANPFRDDFPSLREADPNVDPDWWLTLRKQLNITNALAGNGTQDITVPPNHYFVLGDNRNDSEDSRYWGFVPRTAILGRPLFIYFTLPPVDTDNIALNPLQRVLDVLKHIGDTLRIVR
jgi:signal peptidase I